MQGNESPAQPTRVHLTTGNFGSAFDRIETYRITMQPGQASGAHTHPGGVMGYVESGAASFKVMGEEQRELRAGSTFYEPPEMRIERFDNASGDEPLVFIAFYPLLGVMSLFDPVAE